MKTIVVGAGISGLAAAYTLRRHDIDTLVLEEKSLPGGRAMGTRKQGFVLDHGAQFFMKCYDTTLSLIHELSLAGDIVPQRHRPSLLIDGDLVSSLLSFDLIHVLKTLKSPADIRRFGLKALLQTARFSSEILKRRKTLDFIHYEDALDLDMEHFSEFVLRHGGREALESVFQPMIAAITLGNAEEIGTLYGAALFWNLMRGGHWILENGIQSLPERLCEEIKPALQLSTPVRRIVLEDGRVKGVETQHGFVAADAVICATTATVARKIIPDLPGSVRSILEKVQYRPCCHVVFAYDRPVLPNDSNVLMLPRKSGSSMAAVANSAESSHSYAPEGTSLAHCFVYDRFAYEFNRMPDEKIILELKSELRKYIPRIPDDSMFSEVYRWNEAMCFAPPGMYTAVHKLKKENGRHVRGLYFAGDYLNLASVEGSARSGVDAAEQVVQRWRSTPSTD
jgi:protoporphyrinogen oxidase